MYITQEYFPFKNPAALFWQLLSSLLVSFKICVTLAVLEQSVEKVNKVVFSPKHTKMTFLKNVDLENEDEAIIMLFVTLVYPLLCCFCIFLYCQSSDFITLLVNDNF